MDTPSQAKNGVGQGWDEEGPIREYTLQELAALWGVSVKSVRRYVTLGQLPAIREPHGAGWTYKVRLPEGAPRFVGRGKGGARNVRRVREGGQPSPQDSAVALVGTLERAFAVQERTVQALTDDLRAANERIGRLERELGAAEERLRLLRPGEGDRRSLRQRLRELLGQKPSPETQGPTRDPD